MTNNLKLQFVNSVLKYDFFLVEIVLNSKLKHNRYFFKKFGVKNNNKLYHYFLNMLELIKNLKQIIRILQFIKKRNRLNLKFKRTYSLEFLSFLLEKNKNIVNKIYFNKKEYINLEKSLQFYCFVDFEISQDLSKKLLHNDKFLIAEINTSFKQEDIGVYKLFNNFKNFQKIVFFAILLKNIFKN